MRKFIFNLYISLLNCPGRAAEYPNPEIQTIIKVIFDMANECLKDLTGETNIGINVFNMIRSGKYPSKTKFEMNICISGMKRLTLN